MPVVCTCIVLKTQWLKSCTLKANHSTNLNNLVAQLPYKGTLRLENFSFALSETSQYRRLTIYYLMNLNIHLIHHGLFGSR